MIIAIKRLSQRYLTIIYILQRLLDNLKLWGLHGRIWPYNKATWDSYGVRSLEAVAGDVHLGFGSTTIAKVYWKELFVDSQFDSHMIHGTGI